MDANPAELLQRSKKDPTAFSAYYRTQFEPVLAYFARRTFDAEDAVDLTAEVFAQAYLSRHRFRGTLREEAEAWTYKIAKRQFARYAKRGSAQDRARRRLEIEAPAINAERRAAIEDLSELEGLRSLLRSELTRLSAEQREAVALRVLGDLPFAEVARRLGISEQAARARVSRALASLASAFDENPTAKEML